MELFVSPVEIEDASIIIDYLNQVGGESDFLQFGKDECLLNEYEEMEIIQDFIESDNSLMLLGFIDDELVSLLSITGETKKRLHHIGHFAITVKKEYWNMSIGTVMMEEMIELLKETPLKILDLEVRIDNIHAIQLYRKFGFEEVGTYKNYFYTNNEYHDALLMNLYLK